MRRGEVWWGDEDRADAGDLAGLKCPDDRIAGQEAWTVSRFVEAYPRGTTDFSTLLTKVRAANPDVWRRGRCFIRLMVGSMV